MESKSTELKSTDSKSRTIKVMARETGLLFLGGAGAGAIAFALVGGAWHVNHFVWVMAATILSCGFLAVILRQNFKTILNALMDNAPWL